MEVRLGYKQTEFGPIPEEWAVVTISEFAGSSANIVDGPFGSNLKSSDYVRTGIPVLQGLNITGDRFVWRNVRYIEEAKANELLRSSARVGDLLTVKIGSVGFSAIIDDLDGHSFAIIPANLLRVRFRDEGDASFAFYALTSPFGKRRLKELAANTAQPALSLGGFRKLSFPSPTSVVEQSAISTTLSDMDAILGGLDRLIAKKRDLKQAAMQQLLTGQTRLPGFQGKWELKRLDLAGKCLRGVTYRGDSDLSTHDTLQTKRLLRSNNVQDAVVVIDDVQFVNHERVADQQLLRPLDILICMANGSKALVGKAGQFRVSDGYEYTFGAFMACFRTNAAEANPSFVFYLFQTSRYRDYINNLLAGSSINNLSPSNIESLEFVMPTRAEQSAIARVLTEIDAELSALEARRDKTRALKHAMMQELLTGRTRLA